MEELEARDLPSAVAHPDLHVTPLAGSSGITYYTPAQVRHAYGFDQVSATGAGQTVALIDAYDDPNISADLAHFDAQFGLPAPPALTKFRLGSPAVDAGWAGEIALDVEWAHALAPQAKLLLVEARSANLVDLLGAVDYARDQPGVAAVSMSWGAGEWGGESAYDYHFTTPAGHTGITFVASAGDGGAAAGPEWPAVSANVLAVGGTSLTLTAAGAYGRETAWSSGGGGASQVEGEPTFQAGVQASGRRATPDVAYDADPTTGFLVYDSVPDANGQAGWFSYGGTSAGAPQWAALLALADQGRAQRGLGALANAQAALYALPAADFHDVTSGSNGVAAAPGYDLATGRGTPNAALVINDLLLATSSATVNVVPTQKPAAGAAPRAHRAESGEGLTRERGRPARIGEERPGRPRSGP